MQQANKAADRGDMAHPKKGIITLLPSVIQPFSLRTAYGVRIGKWSPFGLLPSLDKRHWPDDLWVGNEERGKHVFNRRFTLAGCDISFSRHIGWFSKEGSTNWLRALHSFDWMRDVIAYNDSKTGAKLLRGFVEDWIFASDRMHAIAREPEIMGERVANWVLYTPVIQRNAPKIFRRRVLHASVRQALILRGLLRAGDSEAGLSAIKGLLYVALTLPQCSFLYDEALDYLQAELDVTLNGERHKKIRNPEDLHRILRNIIDIRLALEKLADKEHEKLEAAISLLGKTLQYFLHADGGFPLFNGANQGDATDIAQTLDMLQQISAKSATSEVLIANDDAMMEFCGYGRLEAGKSVVLMDVAAPEVGDGDSYFGALSFEMSHGLQRYVVNCGTFIGNDPAWSRVVRTTAAHSTICVDDRNSCQLHKMALPKLEVVENKDAPNVARRIVARDGYQFFEGIYNGYVPYSGLVHTRQLLMNDAGERFSGADHLEIFDGYDNARSHDVNLRFHLHPSVKAKRLMNGMVSLSSQDGEEEWMFHASVGQAVELEEGIYLGIDGKPVSTTQIVIYAPFSPETPWAIEWSFIKN